MFIAFVVTKPLNVVTSDNPNPIVPLLVPKDIENVPLLYGVVPVDSEVLDEISNIVSINLVPVPTLTSLTFIILPSGDFKLIVMLVKSVPVQSKFILTAKPIISLGNINSLCV